ARQPVADVRVLVDVFMIIEFDEIVADGLTKDSRDRQQQESADSQNDAAAWLRGDVAGVGLFRCTLRAPAVATFRQSVPFRFAAHSMILHRTSPNAKPGELSRRLLALAFLPRVFPAAVDPPI